MDETLGDFATADILIEEGAILAVGRSLDAAGTETIDAAGMIALPGIIDAHTCLWQTVLRGYVPDLWPGAYYSRFLPLRSCAVLRSFSKPFVNRGARKVG